MKILLAISMALTLVFSVNANASKFFRKLCTKYLYADIDPWPFAEYSNKDLYDLFKMSEVNDDLKKEISYRLIKFKLKPYDRALLMSTLGNLTPDEKIEIVALKGTNATEIQ